MKHSLPLDGVRSHDAVSLLLISDRQADQGLYPFRVVFIYFWPPPVIGCLFSDARGTQRMNRCLVFAPRNLTHQTESRQTDSVFAC